MIRRLIYLLPLLLVVDLAAQEHGATFEMRAFSDEPRANGETDFKGESEFMETDERIKFLNDYATYAADFFTDPNLDRQLLSSEEIDSQLALIKPQPLPTTRKTILLNNWKSYGFRDGQDLLKESALEKWTSKEGIKLVGEDLILDNATFNQSIDSLDWRFKVSTRIQVIDGGTFFFALKNSGESAIALSLEARQLIVISDGLEIRKDIGSGEWVSLTIEADFTQKRFNVLADGIQVCEFIPMSDTSVGVVTELAMSANGRIQMGDIFIFKHKLTGDANSPYASAVVLDENFERKPTVSGWQRLDFDDSNWRTVKLPSVHAGVENILAIKVHAYKMTHPIGHAPSDRYTGCFLGRAKLLLTDRCMIKNVQTSTVSIDNSAIQSNQIFIQYNGRSNLFGTLELNYYPWFPDEGGRVASVTKPVEIRPAITNEFEIDLTIPSPELWSSDSPKLYRVELIIKDTAGHVIDDFVTTTGIRTIGQEKGAFLFNGRPELLNGAQIMGFRTPIETISKTTRCASPETIAEELLSIKKMNGNLLRMHVHSERDKSDGINDPRYAEFADQMGICLIWQTPAWTRSGNAWHIDFEGYSKYMEQVHNHPSIVIWEAGNHPNRFKEGDLKETNDYVQKIYNAIYPYDQSRLISPTTFWQHTHYGNYDGTIDYQGRSIEPAAEYMAEMVTRGSQDAYAGYGHTWTEIRKMPNSFAASCLEANDKAYFNFEHEESAGQPNWELCKGKPWYLLQSYEWKYDIGSIGRKLDQSEWKASQAWQAFSAWESMKKQVLIGYDGFSWCCLHGGANMGTYQKPLIDNLGHPKLSYYINKMVFQRTWAGSKNVDVVYGPNDLIIPVINHLGEPKKVDLSIKLTMLDGRVLQEKKIVNIELSEGHCIKELDAFQFKNVPPGTYAINFEIQE